MKISANAPCPCHSGKKYKQCCAPYHKGVFPSSALLLMRTRYSAYALGLADYIIKSTHPDNRDYTTDTIEWKKDILEFCRTTQFLGLKIIDFSEGKSEAFVTFEAILDHGSLKEKSRFLKVGERWLYENGSFSS